MAFTTQLFIFFIVPLILLAYFSVYFLSKKLAFLNKLRALDLLLICISICFYATMGISSTVQFLVYILIVYILGFIINKLNKHKTKARSIFFGLAIVFVTSILAYFKYSNMFVSTLNDLFNYNLTTLNISIPLGISFITFSAISYLTDIYRGDAKCGSVIDCALYLSFFPKVISGPIILWKNFDHQTFDKHISVDNTLRGFELIAVGFAKKLILADSFGLIIQNIGLVNIDMATAWFAAILYMMQIYYDFAGYSDIAIGLSRILGYEFKNNFNFPYLSTSISEFWRRWHISLGTWFKEYIYFPLGGSRVSKGRTIFNIGVIFFLTGIWHGAAYTFILWGIINGFFNIIEHLSAKTKLYQKTPKFIKWFATMFITLINWQIFRIPDFGMLWTWLKTMFGFHTFEHIYYSWQYYIDKQAIFLLIIAILGSTVLGLPCVQNKFKFKNEKLGFVLKQACYISLFIIAIMFMMNSSYSPFLYFQY